MSMKTEIRYYSWSWDELTTGEGAAFAEQRTYDEEGGLVERRRIAVENRARTVSTDPRAGAIMREELGLTDSLGSMSAPAWARR